MIYISFSRQPNVVLGGLTGFADLLQQLKILFLRTEDPGIGLLLQHSCLDFQTCTGCPVSHQAPRLSREHLLEMPEDGPKSGSPV